MGETYVAYKIVVISANIDYDYIICGMRYLLGVIELCRNPIDDPLSSEEWITVFRRNKLVVISLGLEKFRMSPRPCTMIAPLLSNTM